MGLLEENYIYELVERKEKKDEEDVPNMQKRI
jgi:hypothetical protein